MNHTADMCFLTEFDTITPMMLTVMETTAATALT